MGCCCSTSKKDREEKKTMGDHLDDKNRNANVAPQAESTNGTNAIELEKKRDQWRPVKKEESNRDIATTTAPRDGGIKMTKSKATDLASFKRSTTDLSVLKFDPVLETERNVRLREIINKLAINVYKAIDHENEIVKSYNHPCVANYVFSPVAIAASMTPAELGATKNFRPEIRRLLGLFDPDSIDSGRSHGDLQDVSWRIPQCGAEIKIVHIICTYTLFRDGLTGFHEDDWHNVEIPRALAAPCKKEWVRVKDKVEEFPRDKNCIMINVHQKLHLINRTNVKAILEHEFRSEKRRMPFYEFGIQRKEVEFMGQGPCAYIPYADLGDLQVIELPLKAADIGSDSYSMIILLPKLLEGIGEIEKRLTSNWLMKTIDAVHSSSSNNLLLVEVPKFTARQNIYMMPIFKQLGFREYDHFERLGDERVNRRDRISRFLEAEHRVTLEIEHDRPEPPSTSSETANEVRSQSPTPTVIKFTCDHPFLFVIANNRSKVIMLMGKVNRIEEEPE